VRRRRGGSHGCAASGFLQHREAPPEELQGAFEKAGGCGGGGQPQKVPQRAVGEGGGGTPRKHKEAQHLPCNALDQGSATWTAGLRTGECFSVHNVTFFGQGDLRLMSRTQCLSILRECRVAPSTKVRRSSLYSQPPNIGGCRAVAIIEQRTWINGSAGIRKEYIQLWSTGV